MVHKVDMTHKAIMTIESRAHIAIHNYFLVKNHMKVD